MNLVIRLFGSNMCGSIPRSPISFTAALDRYRQGPLSRHLPAVILAVAIIAMVITVAWRRDGPVGGADPGGGGDRGEGRRRPVHGCLADALRLGGEVVAVRSGLRARDRGDRSRDVWVFADGGGDGFVGGREGPGAGDLRPNGAGFDHWLGRDDRLGGPAGDLSRDAGPSCDDFCCLTGLGDRAH